jgi:hypothetical protein
MYIILQAMLNHYYVFLIKCQYFVQNQRLDILFHRLIQNQFDEDHSKINQFILFIIVDYRSVQIYAKIDGDIS